MEEVNENELAENKIMFPFPFTPYDVQLDFMQNLYSVLQQGKIGIFESPTGTGKSLSIICGCLKWLQDYKTQRKKELENYISLVNEGVDDQGDDWFASFAKKKEQDEKLQPIKIEYDFIVKHEEKIKSIKNKLKKNRHQDVVIDDSHQAKKARTCLDQEDFFHDGDCTDKLDDSEKELIIENYDSDNEADTDTQEEENKEHVLKIYYTSRTHSQLSQFVGELQASPFHEEVQVTTLGSRQNLCINPRVKKLKNLSFMNEHCMELQKNKSVSTSKDHKTVGSCPFYKQNNLKFMQEHILSSIRDIEQTVELGKQLKACPYYASRYAIPEVEVVVLPYNTLLHKQTRDACGIKLKGHIVVIDEAHNLLEAINNIHSAEVTGPCMYQAYCQLWQYQQRYYSRLSPKNLLYIKQLLYILSAFIKYLGGTVNSAVIMKNLQSPEVKMMMHTDFLSATGVANTNIFKIIKFCEKSQIARKLQGFSKKYEPSVKKNSNDSRTKKSSISQFIANVSFLEKKNCSDINLENDISEEVEEYIASPFVIFLEFLRALTYPSNDGRVLSRKQETFQKSILKFLLLNPAAQFKKIVSEPRSIIVAGGTMQPHSEFTEQLFLPAGVESENIVYFSCGHVIPPENLLVVALPFGPSGKLLDFTYQKRDDIEIMSELGRVLVNLSVVIPGGMVCFFPSYEYEQKIFSYWNETGIIARLENRKKVFREPKTSNQVDKVLSSFSNCALAICKPNSNSKQLQNGAILFSIVGGKMSEGINFSNDLGRCVVMVGLPYPNANSLELKEKMNFLNKTVSSTDGKTAGQKYYENLCMKAVNQSIGRAIRHKNDYATIVLVDSRYTRPSIQSALPGWISSRLHSYSKFGQAFSNIRQFFNEKKNSST